MDLRIAPLNPASMANLAPVRGVGGTLTPGGPAGGSQSVDGAGFSQALRAALQSVSAAQNQAGELQTQLQLGTPGVSLEETMLSMQKAQIGFQAALHVRNRMMQAYTDVMNMQV